MENLAFKVRIAVLWLFMAVSMSAHSALFFMEPGAIEMITSGEIWMGMDPRGMLIFMALFYWIPLVMAFLSVTLKDLANRRANGILGMVFTGLNIFHLTEHLATGAVHQILIIGSTVVVTALIAWYAWKWPKLEV